MQDVRDSASTPRTARSAHEGNEIEQETAAAPEHEGGSEQHQEVAVGRQARARTSASGCQREREHDDRRRARRWAVDVIDAVAPSRWPAPPRCSRSSLRLPFLGVPLTADEGGYAEVARLWGRGAVLYDRVDGIGSTARRACCWSSGRWTMWMAGRRTALRSPARGRGGLVVAVTMVVTARLAGRIPAILAGLRLATVGAAPVDRVVHAVGRAACVGARRPPDARLRRLSARRRRCGWLLVCGLLTGCAVLVKQSGVRRRSRRRPCTSLWTRRRAGLAPGRRGRRLRLRARGRRRALGAELRRLVVRDGDLPRPGATRPDGLAGTRLDCSRARCRRGAVARRAGALAAIGWRRWPAPGCAVAAAAAAGRARRRQLPPRTTTSSWCPPLAVLGGDRRRRAC